MPQYPVSLKTITFKAQCFLEGSWGSRDLGERDCSMELFDYGAGHAAIEFVAGEDVEHIGLTYDARKNITDYDGVFSVPHQGIALLKEQGFNTEAIE